MLTFLPCLPLCDKKGLQRGSQAPQDPPPPPTYLPSYALWHSYWAACFRHSMRNRSGNGLLMRNRSQNGHDEKKLRALDWWVHFQKRLSKGGSQEARNPSPPPTHTHRRPLALLLGSSFQTVRETTLKMGTTRKSTEL